jgi:hypothetical protein
MSKLVHNEKVKMSATLCNNLAVGFLITGWLVPMIGFIVRMGGLEVTVTDVIIFFIISNTLGVGAFWVLANRAQNTLNGLIE